ncbi:hypothetical protein J4444_01220 [Candidatus Woesearchaeota archaeon]|nr:hypothetical protein [Candidatus Woesearchaeota archaeon]
MIFANDKKTFLAKADKSKKGEIDARAIPIIETINKKDDYYTTSSCSGRVYFCQGKGKKNEMDWIIVSHDLINSDFLELGPSVGSYGLTSSIWLRIEPFILHVACKDLDVANKLLENARKLYKKSCLLTVCHKIVVEIRGSELLEMPYVINNIGVFSGDRGWLVNYINQELQKIWDGMERFNESI